MEIAIPIVAISGRWSATLAPVHPARKILAWGSVNALHERPPVVEILKDYEDVLSKTLDVRY